MLKDHPISLLPNVLSIYCENLHEEGLHEFLFGFLKHHVSLAKHTIHIISGGIFFLSK